MGQLDGHPTSNRDHLCGFEPRRALCALVAQLDRAPDSYSGRCGFESRRALHGVVNRRPHVDVVFVMRARAGRPEVGHRSYKATVGGSSPSRPTRVARLVVAFCRRRNRKLPYRVDWDRVRRYAGYLAVVCLRHPRATRQGHVLVHRVVMEHQLRRVLGAREVVHHRNGDPYDNRLDNLLLLSPAEHTRLHHRPQQMVDLVCAWCGKAYRRLKGREPAAHGRREGCCSRSCSAKRNARLRFPVPAHGIYNRYRRGCRCKKCRAANTKRMRAWLAARRRGGP